MINYNRHNIETNSLSLDKKKARHLHFTTAGILSS